LVQSLCCESMGHFGKNGSRIKTCLMARVMATRRIFRLRGSGLNCSITYGEWVVTKHWVVSVSKYLAIRRCVWGGKAIPGSSIAKITLSFFASAMNESSARTGEFARSASPPPNRRRSPVCQNSVCVGHANSISRVRSVRTTSILAGMRFLRHRQDTRHCRNRIPRQEGTC